MTIYLASSWRNPAHDAVHEVLKSAGFDVYNYRDTNASFHWRELDSNWTQWTVNQYLAALETDKAVEAFHFDMLGLLQSDILILIEPSGISAHMELGWAVGKGLRTAIFHSNPKAEPELMSKMVDFQTDSLMDLLAWLEVKD